MPDSQHRFGNMAAEVLNSSSVLRLNFCAKLNICASISATSPSREPLCASAELHENDRQSAKKEIKFISLRQLTNTEENDSGKDIK